MTKQSNRERQAAALAYKSGDYAPKVIASGRGATAEAIISLAREAGVYVHESPEMVSLLMNVDHDQYIPPELYVAVAELLVWLYWLESDMPADGPYRRCSEGIP
jgi:flagellar biosynthesis protein